MENYINISGYNLFVDYIPTNIMKDPNMTSNEKIVFELIYSKFHKYINSNDKPNYCSLDIDSLAHESHSTHNMVNNYLKDLSNSGWINLGSYGSLRFINGVNDKKCLDAEKSMDKNK